MNWYCPYCGTRGSEQAYPASRKPLFCWDCLSRGHGWISVIAGEEYALLAKQEGEEEGGQQHNATTKTRAKK